MIPAISFHLFIFTCKLIPIAGKTCEFNISLFLKQQKQALESVQGDHELEGQLKIADGHCKAILSKLSSLPGCASATITLAACAAMGYGFYLLSPGQNPWQWDGWVLLSKTHFQGFSLAR